jgi:hypothetical protein
VYRVGCFLDEAPDNLKEKIYDCHKKHTHTHAPAPTQRDHTFLYVDVIFCYFHAGIQGEQTVPPYLQKIFDVKFFKLEKIFEIA